MTRWKCNIWEHEALCDWYGYTGRDSRTWTHFVENCQQKLAHHFLPSHSKAIAHHYEWNQIALKQLREEKN